MLGPIWAIGNGITLRYLKVMAAPFLVFGVGFAMLDREAVGWATPAILVTGILWSQGAILYFAARAFDWRLA